MVVVGFFFLILTVQKLRTFTLLRATGASTRSLAGSVTAQIAAVILIASAIAVAMAWGALNALSTGLAVTIDPMTTGGVVPRSCWPRSGGVALGAPDLQARPGDRSRCPMNLALAEFRRAKGRFASITAALSLIVFLVLILGALGDGLFFGGTGAIRSSTAQAYAFASDAEGSLVRSRLPLSAESELEALDGVEQATAIGALITTTSSVPGGPTWSSWASCPRRTRRGCRARVLEGRLPSPEDPSGVAVDEALADAGLGLGTTLEVGGVTETVVGVVADAGYQGLPTAWTSLETYADMRTAVRPEFAGQPVEPSVFGLALAEGVTAEQIAPPAGDRRGQHRGDLPVHPGHQGAEVQPERDHLRQPRRGGAGRGAVLRPGRAGEARALRRAQGAGRLHLQAGQRGGPPGDRGHGHRRDHRGDRRLARGRLLPDDIPFLFRPQTLAYSAVLTVTAGVVGALLSLRRISRIDPATALGGTL